jgi:Lipase (class 3)
VHEVSDSCSDFESDQKEVIVAFRGTVTNGNILSDLEYKQIVFPNKYRLQNLTLGTNEPNSSLTYLHAGFVKEFESVSSGVYESIFSLLRNYSEVDQISFVGHSLGGAMATIASLDFARNVSSGGFFSQRIRKIRLFTFGSPRVGNSNLATELAYYNVSAVRVKEKSDPVTILPPRISFLLVKDPYWHVGKLIIINESAALFCSSPRIPSFNESESILDEAARCKYNSLEVSSHLQFFEQKKFFGTFNVAEPKIAEQRPAT